MRWEREEEARTFLQLQNKEAQMKQESLQDSAKGMRRQQKVLQSLMIPIIP
jgi:hypothetical protein